MPDVLRTPGRSHADPGPPARPEPPDAIAGHSGRHYQPRPVSDAGACALVRNSAAANGFQGFRQAFGADAQAVAADGGKRPSAGHACRHPSHVAVTGPSRLPVVWSSLIWAVSPEGAARARANFPSSVRVQRPAAHRALRVGRICLLALRVGAQCRARMHSSVAGLARTATAAKAPWSIRRNGAMLTRGGFAWPK